MAPHGSPNEVTPRELTRRRVDNVGGGHRIRESSLNQEVVMLTQRQLTSEFEVAEMNSLRVEAEVKQQNVEQELSQEINMLHL